MINTRVRAYKIADGLDPDACSCQTGYGLPWSEFCAEVPDPASPWGYCAEHTADVRENYPQYT